MYLILLCLYTALRYTFKLLSLIILCLSTDISLIYCPVLANCDAAKEKIPQNTSEYTDFIAIHSESMRVCDIQLLYYCSYRAHPLSHILSVRMAMIAMSMHSGVFRGDFKVTVFPC